MRALVVVLAVLAALKIWSHDRIYRGAVEEALLAAYLASAQAACQAERPAGPTGMPLAVGRLDWRSAETAQIVIGNPQIDVQIWQVDDARWNARYKHPIVRLTIGDRLSRVACDYDVVAAHAALRML